MLIDNVNITIKAGNGGDGAATFLRNSQTYKGGPDGGNGGNGGNIYVQGSSNINDLKEFRFKKKIKAQDGIPGRNKKLFGKNAEHLTIFLPLGTKVIDETSHEEIEITDTTSKILIAKGGRGGRGNAEFSTPTNRTPMFAEKGEKGIEKHLHLELSLIADIGLIGLPNAGKSSLLAALTSAHPKIGDYAFTTLEPNLGVLNKYTIADIPGLIQGASEGKGLGIKFLKHIQKTKLLVHCIEAGEQNPEKAYKTIRDEFSKYDSSLLNKPEVLVITKKDLADNSSLKKIEKTLSAYNKKIIFCSIYDPDSLILLKNMILKYA